MEWVIIAVVGMALLVFILSRVSRGHTPTERVPAAQVARPESFLLRAPARQEPSRLSAREMLSRLQTLRDSNAQWDAIWSHLNPCSDPEVQQLLVEIRGPHMFAPHVGLSVIEDGCKQVLASSPTADALTALRVATRRAEPFVR